MKKKPQRPVKPLPPGRQGTTTPPPGAPAGFQPGGVMRAAPATPPARHPAPKPVHKKPAPVKKPAAKKKPVKRKLALGEAVACCAAEALAASLRLTGWRVTDADVLALYELTADGPDDGASILATLEAASELGLADCHPAGFEPAWSPREETLHRGGCNPRENPLWPLRARDGGQFLILGVDLPGPHAVTLGPDGAWWSWGEPYDPAAFPGAVIEEAWEVTW